MKMRAVVYKRGGGPEVLELLDVKSPVRGPGQMLVKVLASSVNPVDWKLRAAGLPIPGASFYPKTVGCDVCGIVEACDEWSTRFAPGDRVYFMLPIVASQGGSCEFVTVDESHAALAPSNLSDQAVASLPLVGQTVLQAFESSGIDLAAGSTANAGKSILVHAGAGGVGNVAIQVAKHCGLKVYTTCSERNVDFVTGTLGADVAIDYNKQRFEDVAKDMDYVFDLMGGTYELRSMKCIKSSGTYINIMNSGWASWWSGSAGGVPDGVTGASSTVGSLIGYSYAAYRKAAQYVVGPWYHFALVQPRAATLFTLAKLCEAGGVVPVIDSEFPLDATADAHRRIESGHARGKVIVNVASATAAAPPSKL